MRYASRRRCGEEEREGEGMNLLTGDWRIAFAICMAIDMFGSVIVWGLLGPFAGMVWSGACFTFGAMFAQGRKEVNEP